MKFVDKIAKSKYFQKAKENEYIKKKIEEMSNTPLLLAVEVKELSGTLAVNIPPPPTDRIWYEPLNTLLMLHWGLELCLSSHNDYRDYRKQSRSLMIGVIHSLTLL